MKDAEFRRMFLAMMHNRDNPYHPLVWINGDPEIGEGTYIGGLSEVNAKGAKVRIGRHCDIASFVAINVSDSHKRSIGISDDADLRDIEIGNHVFVGSHCAILGGTRIGSHSVIAAGVILRGEQIPPFSLVTGPPTLIKPGYYHDRYQEYQAARKAGAGPRKSPEE